MQKMMDMARPKPKKGEENAPMIASESYEKYPYCLRVTLQGEELNNLKASMKDFSMGKSYPMHCEMEVIAMRESESQGRDPDQSVEFQIKKMGIEFPKKSHSDMVQDGMKVMEKAKS